MVNNAVWIYSIILSVAMVAVYLVLRWRKDKKPIIHNFTASNIWKAFILNSIAAALVILVAIVTKNEFDTNFITGDNTGLNYIGTFFTLVSTFVTSMVAFTLLYVVFGFGGGMIAITGNGQN